MKYVIAASKLETERDALTVRGMTRRVAELLGFDDLARNLIGAAVSGVALHSLPLAASPVVEFGIDGAETMTVRISCPDECHDFQAERQLVDSLEIEREPRSAVLLRKRLPLGAPRLTKDMALRI